MSKASTQRLFNFQEEEIDNHRGIKMNVQVITHSSPTYGVLPPYGGKRSARTSRANIKSLSNQGSLQKLSN